MTRVPTTMTDPFRATQVTGSGFRGENSPAALPAGDFLHSLLSFSPGVSTQPLTADLRFNQLVGALQFNRPGGSADDFEPLNARGGAGPLDDSPADMEDLADSDADSDRDRAAARRRERAEVWSDSEWRAGQLWGAALSDPRFRQTRDLRDDQGVEGGLGGDRFANQRSSGFPTADRAAALELARQASLGSASAVAAASYPEGLRQGRGFNAAGSEGGLRLDGAWQRVVGGETVAGGIGRDLSAKTAAPDAAAVTDLQRPGQLDPLIGGLEPGARSRSLNAAGDQGPGWQLSFQADRAGVRSGRLNFGAKAKAREGLKPDGVGPVERAVGPGPANPPATTRPDLTLSGPVVRPGFQLSLDELSLAPAAARAMWESGLGGIVAPEVASIAGVLTEALVDLTLPAMDASLTTMGSLPLVESPGLAAAIAPTDSTTGDLTLSGVANRGDLAMAADSEGAVSELAGSPRTLPARVLNQVALALRDAPVGDSTLRLQLNPVDLGQLSIEISFRDGVMHGKLRAEQGQTLRWLQEGLEGLKSRLSEQGIVVQALEVELGQQGDFSQQSGAFSPGPDSGRQRSGRGYFTPDGPNRRAPAVDQDSTIQPTARDTSGQWAVNVIV